MRFFLVLLAVISLSGPRAAVAQRADASASADASNRLALASPPAASARGPRLACAPLSGKVFDPNGQPLVGATLLIQGTHDVYVTDSDGRFQLTAPVYEGQVLAVQAAGYQLRAVPLTDCTLPRLVLEKEEGARIKRTGKRAGQVTRLNNRNTNMK